MGKGQDDLLEEENFIVLSPFQYAKYTELGMIGYVDGVTRVIMKNPYIAIGTKVLESGFIPNKESV